MYGAAEITAGESERTAFRNAEKRYKLYKSQPPRSISMKKQMHKGMDLSDVFDFRAILVCFQRSGESPDEIFRFECPGFHRPVFCFNDRPGFFFIPGALTLQEQCHWVRESLTTFPQPPNRTNHTVLYGPIFGLFNAVQNLKVLSEEEPIAEDSESGLTPGETSRVPRMYLFSEASAISRNGEPKSIAASLLLRKLR